MNKISLIASLVFLSVSAFAQARPAKILYVGAISIEPCHDEKVLADWYSKFGIETHEDKDGYFALINTAAGPFFFGIHRKKTAASCSASVNVVFRVEDFEGSLSALKSKGLLPDAPPEGDSEGRFATFHDPDGNKVAIWGN